MLVFHHRLVIKLAADLPENRGSASFMDIGMVQ